MLNSGLHFWLKSTDHQEIVIIILQILVAGVFKKECVTSVEFWVFFPHSLQLLQENRLLPEFLVNVRNTFKTIPPNLTILLRKYACSYKSNHIRLNQNKAAHQLITDLLQVTLPFINFGFFIRFGKQVFKIWISLDFLQQLQIITLARAATTSKKSWAPGLNITLHE